jgi:hypothetical protein
MPIAIPLAIAGGTIAAGAMSASASRSAASTQAQASDRAADLQNQQFQQLLALQMPGYGRAESASNLYMQALGIPNTGAQAPQPGTPSQPQTPNLSYGGTGGIFPMTGGQAGGGQAQYSMMQADSAGSPQYAVNEGGPQVLPGVPGQPTAPTGTGIAGGQQGVYDMVSQTPGYQAQLDQGLKAIDRASPMTGGMYSGRRMKALNDYGQNTFGSYYDNWLNRVGGMAGQSTQIANNIGQAGMQNANNVGNLMMTGANARAQGQTNSANAWTSAIGTGVGMYGGSQGWFG